jgi:hypothetical protein
MKDLIDLEVDDPITRITSQNVENHLNDLAYQWYKKQPTCNPELDCQRPGGVRCPEPVPPEIEKISNRVYELRSDPTRISKEQKENDGDQPEDGEHSWLIETKALGKNDKLVCPRNIVSVETQRSEWARNAEGHGSEFSPSIGGMILISSVVVLAAVVAVRIGSWRRLYA